MARRCTTAASTPATTIAPTTTWFAFTVSASKSSREALAIRLPICSRLRLFRRSKKRARWARHWRRGLTFAPGSAFPAAMKSMFRTANEWPIAPLWLLRFRKRWLSVSTAFRRSGSPALIAELKAGSDKPIVVYPNSGEGWDATRRSWTGVTDPAEFGVHAKEWFKAGAHMVGGCCRTRPEHIARVAEAASHAAD